MLKWILWPALIAALLGLACCASQHPTDRVVYTQGLDLNSKLAPDAHTKVGVIGTVTEVKVKRSTGMTTVSLDADDGYPVKVLIGPTLSLKKPHVGERLQLHGSQTDTGILVLNSSRDLKRLAPSRSRDNEATYAGDLYAIPKYKRVWTEARLLVQRETNSGAWMVGMTDPRGQFLGSALVRPALQDRLREDSPQIVKGYLASDGLFMVEELGD